MTNFQVQDIIINMEDVIFSIHPSIRPLIIFYALAVVLFLLALWFFLFPVSFIENILPVNFLPLSSAGLGIIFLIIGGLGQIQKNFTTYILTKDSLKIVNRFIGGTEITIPLIKIQDVTFTYSVMQTFFGIGDIFLASADERLAGDAALVDIDSPEKHKNEILSAIGNINKPGDLSNSHQI
jgi:hypothetical protein